MAPGCDRVSWVLCENLPLLVQASAASTADFSVSCADSAHLQMLEGQGCASPFICNQSWGFQSVATLKSI